MTRQTSKGPTERHAADDPCATTPLSTSSSSTTRIGAARCPPTGTASRHARAPRGPRAAALAERRAARDTAAEHPSTRSSAGARTSSAREGAPSKTRAASAELDPIALARDLAHCVSEVMTGARELDTIARWLSGEVYRHLGAHATIAARARSVRRLPVHRPCIRTGSVRVSRPTADVIEAAVVVHTRARARAVALRLVATDGRWRATFIGVL